MTDPLETLNFIVLAFTVPVFAGVLGLLLMGINRKLESRMQSRIGPPISQPFRDLFKLMCKESAVPDNAVGWIFNGAPIMGLVAAVAVLFYLPIGTLEPMLDGFGDLILVLYLLMLPSLMLVVGGFAAGSPYASIGAQREMVMMMSYELPLAATVIGVATVYAGAGIAKPFGLMTPLMFPVWEHVGGLGLVGLGVLFLVLMAVIPGEMGSLPFDAPEAETELGAGVLSEYSGRNLAFVYLTDGVKKVILGSIVVALFIPWGISDYLFDWLGVEMTDPSVALEFTATLVDLFFFMIKLFLVNFVAIAVARVSFARLQIDRIAIFYWLPVTMTAVAGLALVWLDVRLL